MQVPLSGARKPPILHICLKGGFHIEDDKKSVLKTRPSLSNLAANVKM